MADKELGKPMWGELKAAQHTPSKTAWLMSFIDLTGILVGFFVLVFSTQTIDRSAWQELSGGFRAAFNPHVAVMPVIPDGQANAYQVVPVKRDVLPYLDSLLRGRVAKDPVWHALVGTRGGIKVEPEMLYAVPDSMMDVKRTEVTDAWHRLANVVGAWKNPVMVRVVVPEGGAADKAAALALELAAAMHVGGAANVTAEVVSGSVGDVLLVVRGE